MNRISSLAGLVIVMTVTVVASAAGEGGGAAKSVTSAAVSSAVVAAAPATPPPVVGVTAAAPASVEPAAAAAAAVTVQPTAAAASGARPAEDAGSEKDSATDPCKAFWVAVAAMGLFAFMTIGGFVSSLRKSTSWSLGDALSEEAGNQPSVLPVGAKPVMVASVSRTIALFGLFVIISGTMGIAFFIVWALFYGQPLDGLSKISPFFYGSAATFAPYAVNQMKEAFASVAATPAPAPATPTPAAAAPPSTATTAVASVQPIAVQPVAISLAKA